jgi:hypothetical protein
VPVPVPVRPKGVEHAVQVAFGRVEEAVVVQRAAAAEVAPRQDDLPAGRLDRLDAGDAHAGVEVVVEGVGEEDDGPAVRFVVPPRRANHCWSVIGANVGSGRRRSMPATAVVSRASHGVWAAKLANSGNRDARWAALSMKPKT